MIVGGPDSVPDFLREPELVVEEQVIVGGPDSLPDFLRYPQVATMEKIVN